MPATVTVTYDQAVAALHARGAELAVRQKFDLDHMRVLMAALGNPQNNFRSVLIAGTNGKGSVAATLASIVAAAGVRTGRYTSPHLSRINERICAWNCDKYAGEIPDEDFAALYARVAEVAGQLVLDGKLPHAPSFFEAVTAIAFCAFSVANVELAILEVGLGGRLDATNIVEPLLCVVTDIDLDHQEWLGNTMAEIAKEKAGILRHNGTMVTLPQHPQVNQALGEVAAALNVAGINAAEYIPAYTKAQPFRNHYQLQVLGHAIQMDSPLSGQHQQRNLALAIAAAVELRNRSGYRLEAATIERGIRDTSWPARLEIQQASLGHAAVLLDVAHNPAGAWTLRAAISSLSVEYPSARTIVFGCLQDKPAAQLVQILFPLFNQTGDQIVLTRPTSPRAADPEELAAHARTIGVTAAIIESPKDALRYALTATPQHGLVICAGSLYLVGELRPLLIYES